jgi:hypothetical protein
VDVDEYTFMQYIILQYAEELVTSHNHSEMNGNVKLINSGHVIGALVVEQCFTTAKLHSLE